jgi:predicted dehydrogenase/nucleoside-diphosphate-sugar epimerase
VRIAITGVTGFIGRQLATRALQAGHEVTAFSRRPWSGEPFVPLADRHFLELPAWPDPAVLANVDVVVHLAIAPQSADPAVTDAVNRVGTERLFEMAQRALVGRFIFVSSQSAHEGVSSAYGQSKYAIERLLADEPNVVIVRPGMVYGDSNDGLMGRATQTAAKLRVFPVIGGKAARAQPIRVNDLADALITLATTSEPPHLVSLGDDARPLGEFVRSQAKARFGITPLGIPVPLGLARLGVKAVSKLGLPSPISEANLDGIAAFEPMDTAADEALVKQLAPTPRLRPVDRVEPRRLILVGAGRIGLVHALTAAHHQQMVLAGIVDLDKAAMGRLASFAGPTLAMFTDLDEAIRTVRPDAAIIGTPPSSHVPLARKLLAAGVDVLVEKPVAASDEDREALAAAVTEYPDRYLGTGYLSGLLPHLAAIAPDFRAGAFGTPTSFDAHSFVSRVEEGVAGQRDMWELDSSISGGGALVNLGVHALAMIDVLLGPAEVEDAVLVAQPNRSTEDGAMLRMRAGDIAGTFTTAWHLPGFDMPENHLRIDTDRGYLLCTTSCAAFVGDDELRFVHQVDADTGFDLAPMDAGGGFWNEQDLLARREPGANSLELAGRIENLITGVYRTADRVAPPPTLATRSATPVYIDVRMPGPMPDLRGAPAGIERASGGALVGTEHLAGNVGSPELIVALPDAPGHFRTLTNKGATTLVRELGVTRLGRAAFGVAPLAVASVTGRPWEALLVLLRAELRRLPREFSGALVVDAYLVDLATATGNLQVVQAALDDLRSYCGDARVGIEVNATTRLVPHIAGLAPHLDLVVALGTTTESSVAPLRELLPASTELIVKTGVLPRELLEIAWDEPDRWTRGASRLVVHWPGAPVLRGVHADALARAKRAAGFDVDPLVES